MPAATLAAAGPSPLWYTTRGTAVVALLLLTASTVLGITVSTRWTTPGWPRFLTQSVHRNLSLLVIAFVTVHVVTAVVDPFAGLGAVAALVPFGSSYRPIWLGLGVVAADLLVALAVTSLLRHRLGYRTWRAVHWLAYACWPAALLHSMGAGTDTRSGWGALLDAACLGAVLAAVLWRVGAPGRARPAVRAAAGTVAVLGAIAVVGFALAGPLRAGWARTAGTPTALLGDTATTASAPQGATPTPTPPPAAGLPPGLDDTLRGTVSQGDTSTQVALIDNRDPSLSLVVTVSGGDDTATTATLRVARDGAVICTVPASVDQFLRAECGTTAVSIALERSRTGVVGEMVTSAGR